MLVVVVAFFAAHWTVLPDVWCPDFLVDVMSSHYARFLPGGFVANGYSCYMQVAGKGAWLTEGGGAGGFLVLMIQNTVVFTFLRGAYRRYFMVHTFIKNYYYT